MGINPYQSGFYNSGTYVNASPSVSNPDAASPLGVRRAEKPAEIERFSGDIFTLNRASETDPSQPDLVFNNFDELTPQNVRRKGMVRGMVFDVDDTLSKYKLGGGRTIPDELKQRLHTLQGSGIQLGIVSNNPDSELVQQFQSELADAGIHVAVISNGQKPNTKSLEMMQEYMGLPANQMMMVGDNPDTDVASGKQAGFKTALVDWFGRSELHQEGMQLGDKALGYFDKFKSIFDSNAGKPQFFPPLQSNPEGTVSA